MLAAGAAVMILFFGIAGGNMFQANQTFAQLQAVTGGDEGLLGGAGSALIFGLILAAVVGAVVFGGVKAIGRGHQQAGARHGPRSTSPPAWS